MEYTFLEQSIAFIYSILLGACLSIVYIPLKIIRQTFDLKKIIVIMLDILFMVISAFSTFLFALAFLYGSVRFYMIIGELIGFILFGITAGKIILKISVPLNKFLIIKIKKMVNLLKKIIKKLLKILYKVLYNVVEKINKFVNFFKKHKKEKINKKQKSKIKKVNSNGRKNQIRRKKKTGIQKKHKRSKVA